ncbi:TonB-dependent receptor [Ahniella affigens]|uniref:TonB-dependent receptor n=1 Tax=Ahniella affigens TaxID=2021234 RepID=A0A2P1PQJ9_9GAMM|nr:TonB-dependent receptor [Ahniella affigens]AVP97114.1 TonB-dependent receptor [Ahniella affigens]
MNHPNRRLHRNLLALSVASLLASPLLYAQDDTKTESESATLETVTVTAQRKEEDVQKVPIAITTVDAEKLDVINSGGDDIRVLSGRLPSLQIESSFGRAFPRFYVRGLGNTDFDLNASQPVSLVYDDIVQENPILKGFPMFDMDRVEMVRGPQGTLFGRNSPAGVIKFESMRPSQTSEGYGQISYGSYGNTNLEGAIGGGFNDAWSGRLSLLYQHRDDYVDNTLNGDGDDLEGYDETAVRGQLLYAPSDDFEALFNLHARNLDGTARLFRANIIRPGQGGLVSGFDPDSISIDGDNSQELDTFGGNARLRWDFAGFSLFSITGYETLDTLSRGDIDGGFGAVFAPPSGPGLIPFTAESADGMPDHHQFTQEFRLQSQTDSALQWQTGFYYFDERITIESFNYDTLSPGRPQNGYAIQKQDNTAYALFGSLEYAATDDLTLRVGLRYTRDEKDFEAERTQSPLSFLGVGPIGPLYANPSDSDVSWDLSAAYAINDEWNAYARVARGFRAPSIQGRLLFGDVLSVADSETVLSFESGIKASLWDNRARLGFAVFSYRVSDQQLTAVGGGANFNTLINADRTVGSGFELDAEAYLTDRLLVTAGVSYNDTEIQDDTLAVQPCGGGCTVYDPAGPVAGTVLLDGNRLPQAPLKIANVTARYGIPMANGELFFFTDWAYRSEVSFFLYDSAEFNGAALLEGGLRVGYNWNNDQYQVALFGRNITDERQVVGGIDFNNLTGFINEPRIIGLEFTARY